MAVCPICGDQIVNGRCKFCGMPYRNEEALYHLNESSREHYRHSSSDVKKKMREAAVPLGDKAVPKKQVISREEVQAKQQQVRQEAMQKLSRTNVNRAGSTANLNGKQKKLQTQKTTYTNRAGRDLAGKGKTGSGRFWLFLIILLAILRYLLPFLSEYF